MKKHLPAIICFIKVCSFTSFTIAQSRPFVPLRYEYPESILNAPKTYVYKNLATGAFRYKDLALERKDTNVIIRWKEYDANPLFDSCTEINHKISDHYLIVNGQATKAITTEDSVYQDGSRFGEKVQTFYFNLNSEINLLMSIRSFFLKDTAITWQGRSVPCFAIQSFYIQKLTNSLFPDKPKEVNGISYFYFGKDVGLLMYRSEMENEKSTWLLVEIKDKKI
jgi:hypothetical protein